MGQKMAAPVNEERAPDVVVEKPDDISLLFELSNNCEETVYYLAYNLEGYSTAPAGHMLYRDKVSEWKARSPGWRRVGEFTGANYHWLPIAPGAVFKFDGSDLSAIPGERAISLFINVKPGHEDRVELISEPFGLTLNTKKP